MTWLKGLAEYAHSDCEGCLLDTEGKFTCHKVVAADKTLVYPCIAAEILLKAQGTLQEIYDQAIRKGQA